MKPKFNTWYISEHNHVNFSDGSAGSWNEYSIFWKMPGNKWMAFSHSYIKNKATWTYDSSDFKLEDGERLAKEKEYPKISIEEAKRKTIHSILDYKRWLDD